MSYRRTLVQHTAECHYNADQYSTNSLIAQVEFELSFSVQSLRADNSQTNKDIDVPFQTHVDMCISLYVYQLYILQCTS